MGSSQNFSRLAKLAGWFTVRQPPRPPLYTNGSCQGVTKRQHRIPHKDVHIATMFGNHNVGLAQMKARMNRIAEEFEGDTANPTSEDFPLSTGRPGDLIFSQLGTRTASHISVERDAVRRRFANDTEAHEASAMLLQAFGLMPAEDLRVVLAKREIRRKRYFLDNARSKSQFD
jgi:hypothetical protein